MLYAENIGLRDCSGFLQIGSHITTCTVYMANDCEISKVIITSLGH